MKKEYIPIFKANWDLIKCKLKSDDVENMIRARRKLTEEIKNILDKRSIESSKKLEIVEEY